jgi:acyl-CoA synthetase (AMP-forming)/AMP-acid ligase II
MTISSVGALIRANARRAADAEAIVEGELRWSFADLDAEMTRVARALIARGIQPGDRVAIWAINSAHWVAAMAGAHAAGATVVPVSSRFKGLEAAHVLHASGARLLFCDADIQGTDPLATLHAADPLLAGLPVVTLAGEHDHAVSWERFIAEGETTSPGRVDERLAAVTADDLAHVIFTSGTTGAPKGAMITHQAILRTAGQLAERFEVDRRERIFVVLPFFHVFGLAMHLMAATVQATCVISAIFDSDELVRIIERERVTVLPGPPTIFQGLLEAPSRARTHLSSLRLAFVTSTGVPGALVRRLLDEGVFQYVTGGYGLTEGIVVSLSLLGEDVERAAEWSGQVLPEVRVRVVGPDGSACAPGEPGEFVIQTPTMMKGYLEDPDATAAAFTEDGWLRTGDIGVVEEDSYVRVTDRKKDMFIVGGFNAYPAEIEAMLRRHPAVGQAAVIGVPDDRLGDVGAAFIVPAADAEVTPDEIISWAKANMANYKVPRYVEIVDGLPLTPSLKVAKFLLRERFNARAPVA